MSRKTMGFRSKGSPLMALLVFGVAVVSWIPFVLVPATHVNNEAESHAQPVERKVNVTSHVREIPVIAPKSDQWETSCALLFFGLPRAFKLLVLPSIQKNLLTPNLQTNCDIYLHYYQVSAEKGGRSGHGGSIQTDDVHLLHEAVHEMFTSENLPPPHVAMTNDTDESFWEKRGDLLKKYRTKKGADGHYLYYPWKAKSYSFPTSIDNIVKQWHSIESAWDLMEESSRLLKKNYTRVAMLRNDAMYMTPFNIMEVSTGDRDTSNTKVAVPNWARFPINDRMVYGPYEGVKIWATKRFEMLEEHVLTYEPGYGMHSERFLNHSIFPAIRDLGFEVVANPEICFLRARADGSAWAKDCATIDGAAKGFRKKNVKLLMEDIVGYPCVQSKLTARIIQVHCLGDNSTNQSVAR